MPPGPSIIDCAFEISENRILEPYPQLVFDFELFSPLVGWQILGHRKRLLVSFDSTIFRVFGGFST
jgi:hypothetical protein